MFLLLNIVTWICEWRSLTIKIKSRDNNGGSKNLSRDHETRGICIIVFLNEAFKVLES